MVLRTFRHFAAAAILCSACLVSRAGDKPAASPDKPPAQASPLIEEDAYIPLADFLAALAIIRTHYVESDKVSWKNLFRASLRGLMHELDPFSQYESPETFKASREDVSGKRVGIGITISARSRRIEIVAVTPGGPADKAGLRGGDILLAIDGESAEGMDVSEAARAVRGDSGSVLILTVYRPSADTKKEYRVKRDVLTTSTVQTAKILPDSGGTAYVRLLMFGQNTASDFEKAMTTLEKQGMDSLILDLRDNPGGLLGAAVAMCGYFLPGGKPVVSIEGRGDNKTELKSEAGGKKYPTLPLIVLINGNSASASEIFSACMRDYKRAVLIGEKSFGKGSVQTIIPFGAKSGALRLTTAKYFTPGRAPIHGHGIVPDIVIPQTPAMRNAISMQLNRNPGELSPLTPNPVRDTALERALELMKGMRILRSIPQNETQKGK